jgi:hypothetical protein
MKPTKETCWALLIGLVLGIPIGWFVRPSDDRYEMRVNTGTIPRSVFRLDKRTGRVDILAQGISLEFGKATRKVDN